MAAGNSNNSKRPKIGVTWAEACRDVTITAMNRGQLPVLTLMAIIIIILVRAPDKYLGETLVGISNGLLNSYLLGYFFWIVTTMAWFFSNKKMRKEYSGEYRRIGVEKSNLQGQLNGKEFPSSNKRKIS